MQHRNIWNHEVLSSTDIDDALDVAYGVIKNSGVAVLYFPFNEDTQMFDDSMGAYAFIQTKDNTSETRVESQISLDVTMPIKIFRDSKIVPCDRDKLQIGETTYYVANVKFYTRDGKTETAIENSILVSFKAIKRSGLSRNKLLS